MKKVEISEELFFYLVQYHLYDKTDLGTAIEKELLNKLDSMAKIQIYTKYKTAQSKEEQENARHEYLKRCGISEDFKW